MSGPDISEELTPSMNLGHRVFDHNQEVYTSLFNLKYPFTLVVPIAFAVLSLYMLWPLFGETWKTGTLSMVFLPVIGKILTPLLSGEGNLVLSVVVLVAYVLTSLTYYWLVLYLSGRHLVASITVLLLLLPMHPFSSEPSERLILALMEGDGAHIIGFMLMPLILYFFFTYIRSGLKSHLYIFIIGSALLSLISFFSVFMLCIFLIFITISEMLVKEGKVKLIRFGKALLGVAIGIVLIYNISLIQMMISNQGREILSELINLFPMSFFIIPVFGTITFLIFDRRGNLQPLFLAFAWLCVFGILYFVQVSLVETSLFDQGRYAPELSFARAFFAGLVIAIFTDVIRNGAGLSRFPQLLKHKVPVVFGIVSLVFLSLFYSIIFIDRTL